MRFFIFDVFTGPYETKVSLDFENEQNFLVVNLATELRQVSPNVENRLFDWIFFSSKTA